MDDDILNKLDEIDLGDDIFRFSSGEDPREKRREGGAKDCSKCTKYLDKVQAACFERKTENLYRRAFSESSLLDILDRDLKEGYSYHVISGGDIDSLSFLKHIIRQQDLDYVLFSTWCMADDDVLQFKEWIEKGKIKRLDAYCGEIFPNSYTKQHKSLKEVVNLCGGRVAIFRNHAKIYAGIGANFAFAIESSANINTNPRTENTSIIVGRDAFDFYKSFFDKIKSFIRDYDGWKPWEGV